MKKYLLLLLVFLSFSVHAEGAAWNRHQGGYVEANVGSGLVFLALTSSDPSSGDSGSSFHSGFYGIGGSFAYGYQFHKGGFALEGGAFAAQVSYTDTNDSNQRVTYTGDMWSPYVAFRWVAHMGGRWGFISKLGLFQLNMSAHDSEGNTSGSFTVPVLLPYTSFGLSYAVTPHLAINAQYQGLNFVIAGAGVLGAGVTYHF